MQLQTSVRGRGARRRFFLDLLGFFERHAEVWIVRARDRVERDAKARRRALLRDGRHPLALFLVELRSEREGGALACRGIGARVLEDLPEVIPRDGVRAVADAGLPLVLLPGVIHLDTVPAHRKVNRIDLGTADKLCAAALGIVDQASRLGAGPRDGLMMGMHARTGISVRSIRTAIEVTVLVLGWLLGGTIGIGTLVFAFGIGPVVQPVLRWFGGLPEQRESQPQG